MLILLHEHIVCRSSLQKLGVINKIFQQVLFTFKINVISSIRYTCYARNTNIIKRKNTTSLQIKKNKANCNQKDGNGAKALI